MAYTHCGQCLAAPTFKLGPMKDGCRIFETFNRQLASNVLCTVSTKQEITH